jgi:hypothetical protein
MRYEYSKNVLVRDSAANLIRDTLYHEFPESYDETAFAEYRRKVYEFVYSTYQAA